uniref:Disintegrin domain-containing protein n=1 Tax=Astyanax mexicanus TaxID=7994 RepID=A0A3B1KFW2_ASTMX
GQECSNPCCNATTCRLTEGSQCADGACCRDCKVRTSRRAATASTASCPKKEDQCIKMWGSGEEIN